MSHKILFSLVMVLVYNFSSLYILFPEKALALGSTDATVSLFARTGTGNYYTLYPDGLSLESANIGGFKSAKIDYIGENIYFFDPSLKVISKINIATKKVTKEIGKPRSTTRVNYSDPVTFDNASLLDFKDFTIDKWGNIYILIDELQSNGSYEQKILKASRLEKNIKEVFSVSSYFNPIKNTYGAYNFTFSLNGITKDNYGYLYVYGSVSYKDLTYSGNVPLVLRVDPYINHGVFYSSLPCVKQLGHDHWLDILTSNYVENNNLGYQVMSFIKGLWVDNDGYIYPSINQYENSSYYPFVYEESSGETEFEVLIGDKTGSKDDIGDGGSPKGAYADTFGTDFFLHDKDSNIYIADFGTNRIRKILSDSHLVTTVVGGGSENITSFGELKSPKSILLNGPLAIFADKSNNFYIAEEKRILLVKNLVQRLENVSEDVNIASLAITKIAGKEVVNPKGEIEIPDLKFDYTFAGDKTVEVQGDFIPDGTSIKILEIGDSVNNSNPPSGKLSGGIASIPITIEAGKTKVIKAETEPFIPAPGVYLPENAPQVSGETYSEEPNWNGPNRNGVNAKGNLLQSSGRFNFTPNVGWLEYQQTNMVKQNQVYDPDNYEEDADQISFDGSSNTVYLNTDAGTGKVKFSIWMRTDSTNLTVPIGIGKACPNYAQPGSFNTAGWEGCYVREQFALAGTSSNFFRANAAVTPVWQKFSIIWDSSTPKQVLIGNKNNINKKFYVWGARLENIN